MKYEATISINPMQDLALKTFLEVEPLSQDDCLGEEETFTRTVVFPDGMEMDVKCCGVQFTPGISNLAWTEAVLFRNGSEVCCSEPWDEFTGLWTLEAGGNEYTANVVVG